MISGQTKGKNTGFLVPFVILLGAYCIWIFTLPMFPSLDGSLHLYYASVLGSLLSGSQQFASYYFIRHILPPYALHYYFLIAAGHFFGYVMADKLLICAIFVAIAYGFRYLASFLGPSGNMISLLIIPLLLNWPLGMGFYNYCLAIGMALWALGFWYRAIQQRSNRLWLAFLAVVILMVLTHPVPLLFVYILVCVDVFCRLGLELRAGRKSGENFKCCFRRNLCDLIYMLIAWIPIGYIFLFIGKNEAAGSTPQTYDRGALLVKLVKLSTLAMFSGSHFDVIAYRGSLYAILLLALVLACIAARKYGSHWTYTPAKAILVCSLILIIAVPFLPPLVNGANYFSQRLVIFVWIGLLAAASAFPNITRGKEILLATCIVLYAVAVLGLGNYMIRPVADQIVEIESAPAAGMGFTGLMLSLPDAPITTDLNYVPYYWSGARYFRRSHSTLLNGGWLYESYVPLGSRVDQLSETLTPAFQDSPGDVYQLLLRSPSARDSILPHADLLVFTGAIPSRKLAAIVRELDGDEPLRIWTCKSRGWYSICTAPFADSTSKHDRKSVSSSS